VWQARRRTRGEGRGTNRITEEPKLFFFSRPCPAGELGDRFRCGSDVAGGEQRLAPVEGEVGACRIGSFEAIDGAPQWVGCHREVVARQGAAARGGVAEELYDGAAVRFDGARTERW
jgi:hypothetical protein